MLAFASDLKDKPNYFICDLGLLWKGPLKSEENLHYATFEGFHKHKLIKNPEEIWVLRTTEKGEDWEEITEKQAKRIIEKYRNEI